MKYYFVSHQGLTESLEPTKVYQSIISFGEGEPITMENILIQLEENYSKFRKQKTIAIIKIIQL